MMTHVLRTRSQRTTLFTARLFIAAALWPVPGSAEQPVHRYASPELAMESIGARHLGRGATGDDADADGPEPNIQGGRR